MLRKDSSASLGQSFISSHHAENCTTLFFLKPIGIFGSVNEAFENQRIIMVFPQQIANFGLDHPYQCYRTRLLSALEGIEQTLELMGYDRIADHISCPGNVLGKTFKDLALPQQKPRHGLSRAIATITATGSRTNQYDHVFFLLEMQLLNIYESAPLKLLSKASWSQRHTIASSCVLCILWYILVLTI